MIDGSHGVQLRSLIPPVTSERWTDITAKVGDLSAPQRTFYVLTGLSSTIAAFGLIANSTAVVIGAMLVAPLMGPIFGIALAFVTGRRRLLLPSLRAELLGVLLALGTAAVIGLVILRPAFGTEILSRTQPTLYDVVIALASGFAGALALVDERISPALPGVAIAVAIVPPLATAGLCLAAGDIRLASGAMLLFFANFLAIELAAAIVFSLAGRGHVHALRDFTLQTFVRRFAVSLVMFLAITAFMTRTLIQLISADRQRSAVYATINESLAAVAGARLSDVHLDQDRDTLRVTAFVYTPRPFEPRQVAQLEQQLRARVAPALALLVRSLLSYDVNRAGLAFATTPEPRPDTARDRRDSLMQRATRYLNSALDSVPGAQLVDVHLGDTTGTTHLLAVVQVPEAVTPARVADWQAAMRVRVDSTLLLSVRSVLVREADATSFRYQATVDTATSPAAPRRGRPHR